MLKNTIKYYEFQYQFFSLFVDKHFDHLLPQIAKRLKDSVQGLGQALTKLVQTAGQVQSNPSDPFAKRELSENAKKVAEQVSHNFS